MDEFDIPIFKRAYDLYKTLYGFRALVPKQDRYTLWQRAENAALDVLEGILLAGQKTKGEKLLVLENVSLKLNILRVLLRLLKETKAIDQKRYVTLQISVDEIGRMLGGWIRSTKERRAPAAGAEA